MKTPKAAWIAALILGLAAAGRDARADGAVRLLVGLTWEGRDLKAHNLEAIQAFRAEFKDIALIHFVSPAYFLRQEPAVAERIKAVMRPGDRVALALGGWKSLAADAGVVFRDGPTFWGQKLRPIDCAGDCGVDVPLSVYPEADQAKLLRAGLAVLAGNGFGKIDAMTATGWIAPTELLRNAAKAGLRYDFSAVAPAAIAARAGRFPLFQWVKEQWPAVDAHTQPFPVEGAPGLIEVPQGLAAIDYSAPGEALAQFEQAASRLSQGQDQLFFLAAYQETAFRELPRLTVALKGIFADAAAKSIPLLPVQLGTDAPTTMPAAVPVAAASAPTTMPVAAPEAPAEPGAAAADAQANPVAAAPEPPAGPAAHERTEPQPSPIAH